VEELDTYVFDIAPRKIQKGHRYFQGKLWVEKEGLAVVKSCGKSVPDVLPKGHDINAGPIRKRVNYREDIQPIMAIYREQVDGYWFPVYSRADDVLQFRRGDVYIRELIKCSRYQRAGSSGVAANGAAALTSAASK
jgi:hypothetical protein